MSNAAPEADAPSLDLKNATAIQIVEAAAKLFAEKGFASTSIREIAAAANVTKPTLYYYFGSKEGLIRHLLEDAMTSFMASIEACEQLESLESALEFILTRHLRFADERPATVALMARADTMPSGETGFDLEEARKRSHLAMMALFQRALERGEVAGEPLTMTLSFVGAMVMHLMIRVERPEIPSDSPEVTAKKLLRLFMHGAKAPAPASGTDSHEESPR